MASDTKLPFVSVKLTASSRGDRSGSSRARLTIAVSILSEILFQIRRGLASARPTSSLRSILGFLCRSATFCARLLGVKADVGACRCFGRPKLFVVRTIAFQQLFAFLVLGHERRRLLWFAVTRIRRPSGWRARSPKRFPGTVHRNILFAATTEHSVLRSRLVCGRAA